MPIKTTLKSRALDEKDKKILMLLQKDGRMQLTEISKKVNLSIDSVHKRIKEMQKKEIFFTGIFIDPRKIGFPLLADIKIKLKNISKEEREKFIEYLINHKRCIDLLAIMGDYDFTCVLIAKDSNDLEEISTEIRQKFKELILEWKGMLILKTYKFEYYDLE
ncbi:MAG TPA: Lrp/AsnC family transcriptional regulator [Candidatus Paceibacterota bacterium]|nr:Lrp/AsnC family transcriptional regulator [Candidatus Paceibacterota bacterium]